MKLIYDVKNFFCKSKENIFRYYDFSLMICLYYFFSLLCVIISSVFLQNIYVSCAFWIVWITIFALIYRWFKSENSEENTMSKPKMSIPNFISILSLTMIADAISFYLIAIIRLLKGDKEEVIQGSAEYFGNGIEILITAIIFGPIVEEILFRGIPLVEIKEKESKIEVIVFTSIIFGLMHGNYAQAIAATLSGIIYGYVSIEFGLRYAIFFHMLSNGFAFFNEFLGITKIVTNISSLIVIWWIFHYEILQKDLKEKLYFQNKFSFKRFFLYFLNPFIFLLMIVWIYMIAISI